MANPAHTRDHVWVPDHSFSTPAAREARRGLEQRAPPVGCAKGVSATPVQTRTVDRPGRTGKSVPERQKPDCSKFHIAGKG